MSLCNSIDTLAMAYLDDELAAEERRELELHMHDCASCRQHVDSERTDLELLRKQLVAPPAPDVFKVRLTRMLDAEDAKAARADRMRWTRHLLPGSALAAAAAALVAFVAVKPKAETASPVETTAVNIPSHRLPPDVQGVSTGPWVQQHLNCDLNVPQFASPGIRLMSARLNPINNHDAVLLAYEVTLPDAHYNLSALVVCGVRLDELNDGAEVEVAGHTLHVLESGSSVAVTYLAPDHTGYAFMSDRVLPEELLRLVASSDLIGYVPQGR
jgi:anti-sigma factor RsiW